MKGIILAGGSGTRLHPMTQSFSKHLLPVYDKPMLYYPLSILMLLGIQDIIMISTFHDKPLYEKLFGDGTRIGLSIKYVIQDTPGGIAEAFLLSEQYLKGNKICLILGDNIFYIPDHESFFSDAKALKDGAMIFGYRVLDAQRYGVVEINAQGDATNIEEKPKNPKSNIAVPGIYFYDSDVFDIAKTLKPSNRGELEITDINNHYLKKSKLKVKVMSKGCVWLDSGTADALLESSHLIQTIEKRQGIKIGCLEEIAINMGYVKKELVREWFKNFKTSSSYSVYLKSLLDS